MEHGATCSCGTPFDSDQTFCTGCGTVQTPCGIPLADYKCRLALLSCSRCVLPCFWRVVSFLLRAIAHGPWCFARLIDRETARAYCKKKDNYTWTDHKLQRAVMATQAKWAEAAPGLLFYSELELFRKNGTSSADTGWGTSILAGSLLDARAVCDCHHAVCDCHHAVCDWHHTVMLSVTDCHIARDQCETTLRGPFVHFNFAG